MTGLRIPLRVSYMDADRDDDLVSATQYALAQYAVYCAGKGLKPPELTPDRQATTADLHQLRYMAWAELRRAHTSGRFPGFDSWDESVDEVASAGEPAAADPTPAGIPGG